MDLSTILLWVITAGALVFSLIKNKQKTLASMKMSKNMMKNMIGQILGILLLIGLILTFVPPEAIKGILGSTGLFTSTILSATIGSITLIPAFVAFPLVGSLVNVGASIVPGVAFLTTLTMVGVVTFPLEKQEFGVKFTISRNILSFIFAVLIALIMGVFL